MPTRSPSLTGDDSVFSPIATTTPTPYNDDINTLVNGRVSTKTNLMTANKWMLGLDRPVSLRAVQVGVADTSTFELDQTFARFQVCGLRNWLVLHDLERCACVADDGGPHSLGDLPCWGTHTPGQR